MDLFDYWARQPPVHELVAGFVGFKPPPRAPSSNSNDAAIAALRRQFPDGRIPANRKVIDG